MNIDKLLEQLTSPEEYRVFAEAQLRQVHNLTKKNKELEEQIVNLKKEAREVVKVNNSTPMLLGPGTGQEDGKIIANIQLKLLKDKSFDGELTMEEAKKVEIYNRILVEPVEKEKKTLKTDIKVIKEEDLLKLANE